MTSQTGVSPARADCLHEVKVVPLKKVITERGHLMEVTRCDDNSHLDYGQAYITMTKPGVVRAWYRHREQTDQIALVKGQLLLVLLDSRDDSPTFQCLQAIRIADDAPMLVQIPAGVWHGFQAIGVDDTYLLHLNSRAYDFENPDEERLAPDDPTIPYRWTHHSNS
jgi:dTDP-4-dehydrorhamnose 3,5-epimerase